MVKNRPHCVSCANYANSGECAECQLKRKLGKPFEDYLNFGVISVELKRRVDLLKPRCRILG